MITVNPAINYKNSNQSEYIRDSVLKIHIDILICVFILPQYITQHRRLFYVFIQVLRVQKDQNSHFSYLKIKYYRVFVSSITKISCYKIRNLEFQYHFYKKKKKLISV